MPPSIQRRSLTKIQQRFHPPSWRQKSAYTLARTRVKVRRPGKERIQRSFPLCCDTYVRTGHAVSFLAPEVWRRGKIKERRGFLTLKGGRRRRRREISSSRSGLSRKRGGIQQKKCYFLKKSIEINEPRRWYGFFSRDARP